MESETLIQTLNQELEKIHSKEDLVQKASLFTQLFNRLTTTLINAREAQMRTPTEEEELFHSRYIEKLKKELMRIYSMDGGVELIEAYQKEALNRLDSYELSLRKKRQLDATKMH